MPTSFFVIGVLLFASLAVHVSLRFTARCRAQQAVDQAALAAAQKLAGQMPMFVDGDMTHATASLRESILQATVNAVAASQRTGERNGLRFPHGELELGQWEPNEAGADALNFDVDGNLNAVRVRLGPSSNQVGRRASVFPVSGSTGDNYVSAEATAVFCDNVRGFRIDDLDRACSLLPFAVHEDHWRDWRDGQGPDDWNCPAVKRGVSPGPDGIPEMRVPVNADRLATVVFGTAGVSRVNLLRQVRYGPSLADFESRGGEFALHETKGTLVVAGQMDLTSPVTSAMESILGQPRTLMLYRHANRVDDSPAVKLTVVGFVGVRLSDFSTDGGDPYLQFQPSVVLDSTTLPATGQRRSWYVRQPARLLP